MMWMSIAERALGLSEIAGPKASPDILAFFRDAGHDEIASDETAWCAAFVCSCLVRSGISIAAVPVGKRLSARAWANFGAPSDVREGAIAVFRRDEAGPAAGHVGFVTGFDAEHITLLGGNQSNKVSIVRMPRAELIACRWPQVSDLEVMDQAAAPPATSSQSRSLGELLAFSRTIRGTLQAALGFILVAYQTVLEVMLDAAARVQEFAPLKGLLTEAGANVGAIGTGFVIWGLSWAIIGRVLAEGAR